MEALTSHLTGFASSIIPVTILLAILIFVHELGHFLVAKFFKVRVETFSLGFGKKIFSYKYGDTVYALSIFPMGGYVKMFGDDPTMEIAPEDRAVSFLHKPVAQRIAVVLAGPLMNFVFAFFLCLAIAFHGERVLAPKLGDIEPTSAAAQAGFHDGDTIVSIDGQPVKTWESAQHLIEDAANQQIPVAVVREDGSNQTISVTPKIAANKNVLSWKRQVGEVDGLVVDARASVIGVTSEQSLAAAAGLKTGDSIKSVNGTEITKWREFRSAMTAALKTNAPIHIEVERGLMAEPQAENLTPVKVDLAPVAADDLDHAFAMWGIEQPDLFLASIEKNSAAERAGLKKGDRIEAIDDTPMKSFDQVAAAVHSYGDHAGQNATAEPLHFKIIRDGQELALNLAPRLREHMNQQGREEKKFEVGIHPLILEAQPATLELQATDIGTALARGWAQTIKFTNMTILTFVRLVQGEVSSKNVGGLFTIGQMAKNSWAIGFAPFLNIMALISINLFILNLLPVPVLDGGHLVFYSIEVLKGAPLSMRKMEIAQHVGLVLLLALMVFAIFNDINRLVFN